MLSVAPEAPPTVATAQWTLWDEPVRVQVTDREQLDRAAQLVDGELRAIDVAASRLRPDSELASAGDGSEVSPLLAELVSVALTAARETDGDVDPAVGAMLTSLGYDPDFGALVTTGATRHVQVGPLAVYRAPSWEEVRLEGRRLTIPEGVTLDLSVTMRARAVDRCASLVAATLDMGVLVAVGGDIATAGPAPRSGWPLLVRDGPVDPAARVALPGGAAVSTASSHHRHWDTAEELVHQIVDPETGHAARPVWRTATVSAFSALRAAAVAHASLARGVLAPSWLQGLGASARLVDEDRGLRFFGTWPTAAET
ncbi:FAD:protein FMN transferase [Asanoa sp. WMMD1127]|uniref:FAD:protein FMN transferase n=1 Tax=Asanoa sp. WMMD1127 TaxID=3016107 RepID=UPI0024167833|nr:FAD:protein FMN transferase [Asanoa sp. WMMD1127]MDG4823419.1 FAD:protein FMN transferase [Asanoa sp. WMMD1127]